MDISHFQDGVDFKAVAAAGLSFVAIKASEHLHEDPLFASHFLGARESGLEVIPYHFYRPTGDAAAQVTFHLGVVKAAAEANLPSGATSHPHMVSALDVELDSGERTMPHSDYVHGVKAWVDAYVAMTGRHPFVYSYRDMWETWMGSPDFSDCHPWIAAYSVQHVPFLAGLGTAVIWQTNDHGSVPGVPGQGTVDLDKFIGTIEQLKVYRV